MDIRHTFLLLLPGEEVKHLASDPLLRIRIIESCYVIKSGIKGHYKVFRRGAGGTKNSSSELKKQMLVVFRGRHRYYTYAGDAYPDLLNNCCCFLCRLWPIEVLKIFKDQAQ